MHQGVGVEYDGRSCFRLDSFNAISEVKSEKTGEQLFDGEGWGF